MSLTEAIEKIRETERNLAKQEGKQRYAVNYYAYRMACREIADFLELEVVYGG